MQRIERGIVNHRHGRYNNQSISSQLRVACGHKVDIHAEATQRTIILEDDRIVAISRTLPFNVVDPAGHRIDDDGDRGLRSDKGQVAKPFHVRCGLFHFRPCRGGHVIRPSEPGMHLFLRKGHLPPAEIGDAGCAMGKSLKRPMPHHARRRTRIMRRPVYRPGLLLHHPPRTFG